MTTYVSECNKTASMWKAVPDECLDLKPHTRANTIRRYDYAEAVFEATGAVMKYGGNRAYYDIAADRIHILNRSQFALPEFYETLFHEGTIGRSTRPA